VLRISELADIVGISRSTNRYRKDLLLAKSAASAAGADRGADRRGLSRRFGTRADEPRLPESSIQTYLSNILGCPGGRWCVSGDVATSGVAQGRCSQASALRWQGQIAMATRGRDLHLNVPLPRKPPDLLMAESPPMGGLSAFNRPAVDPLQPSHAGPSSSILLGSDSLHRSSRCGVGRIPIGRSGKVRALLSISPSSPS
jgi:hypothetical protein